MRDHRKLGREIELFGTDPLIGAGLPYWLPAGAAVRHALEEYLRELERRAGYQHIYSPVLGKRELYEISGHWSHYHDGMYPPMELGGEQVVLRPSLCPHHALVYRSRGRSYRELPLRLAELGGQYRAELSGVLGGLTRVRAMQLNDAHVFCTPDQVAGEVRDALHMIGRPTPRSASSRSGTGCRYGAPAEVRGSLRIWERSAAVLAEILADAGLGTRPAKGRPRSTGRRSTSRWPTALSGRPPCPPSRSTSTSPSSSTCTTSAWTGPGTVRSWCTAASSAAWSGRSRI